MPLELELELEQLRSLIGLGVLYRGVTCCIVEILEDGPALVLESADGRTHQTDQYGEPRRNVPETYTVPVLHESGEVNGEFLGLQVRGRCP